MTAKWTVVNVLGALTPTNDWNESLRVDIPINTSLPVNATIKATPNGGKITGYGSSGDIAISNRHDVAWIDNTSYDDVVLIDIDPNSSLNSINIGWQV